MSTLARRVSRNVMTLSATRVVSMALAFATMLWVTRALQSDAYGLITFSSGLVSGIGLIVGFGLTALGQREVARGLTPLRRLVRAIVGVRLVLLVVAVGVALTVAWLAPPKGSDPALARWVMLIYALGLATNTVELDWVFLGRETVRPVAFAEMISQLFIFGAMILFVRTPDHVAVAAVLYVLSRVVWVGAEVLWYRRYRRTRWIEEPLEDGGESMLTLVRRLLIAALPIGAASGVALLNLNFIQVALGWMIDTATAGHFGVAQRLIIVMNVFIVTYFAALSPTLHRGYVNGFDSIRPVLTHSMRLCAAVGMGFAIGGWMVGERLTLVLFTEEYLPAARPMQIMFVSQSILFLNLHYRYLLIAFDRQRIVFVVNLFATLISLSLALVLIRASGLRDVAFSLLVGQVIMLALDYYWVRRELGRVPVLPHLIRPLAAGAGMAALLWAMRGMPLFMQIPAGAALYFALLMALRVVTPREIVFLVNSLGRAPHPAIPPGAPPVHEEDGEPRS